MKSIVLTGGGTSGHVTPNIALLPGLREKAWSINYIGSKNGIEKQLMENEGIHYHSINTGKLRRYFDLRNFSDIFKVADGFRQAFLLLGKLKPDIVFSKGGFVSCPVVWAAWFRKIPVVIHESDMTPGLTNKLSMPFSKKVCYTFPESKGFFPVDKAVFTGIPIRECLLKGDKTLGLKLCAFSSTKPVVMVIGGSQGSEIINKTVRNALEILLKTFQICHICGRGNVKSEYSDITGYHQFEYVDKELAHLFAASDIVVSRAGATALFEILALKKPALLIPLSRAASRGDQIMNARSFEKQGFSMVLPEEMLDEVSLIRCISEIHGGRDAYVKSMKTGKIGNGTQKILALLDEISGNK
ncbi:MAG: undecaprenyldiphospho-muramoylpentapeptide beta-N-acetylglucosaminyltransferase [Ruminiclostridium sp.]|nr:undecaprenyldiphospho-muramoylpentapeptide beta-N-acetylglucosaminyltransferase [Ruminiclostridium sp.]